MTYRQIHTQIWQDEFFLDLEPDEKLVFIYLFSNKETNLAGLYRLNLKVAAFETGIDLQKILTILKKFAAANKILYEDGIVWVVNWIHYNTAPNSDKVLAGIKRSLASIPDCPLKTAYLANGIPYRYPIKQVSLTVNREQLTVTESRTGTEAEAERKPASSASSFSPPAYEYPDEMTLQDAFGNITGMFTFPSSSRVEDLRRLRSIYVSLVDKSTLAEYLQPFFAAWISRKYRKQNTAWLDWAITGEIPPERKTDKPPAEDYKKYAVDAEKWGYET